MIKEIKIPNIQNVYRVMEIRADGRLVAKGIFRVRRRIKLNGRWTTKVETFQDIEKAKQCARTTVKLTSPHTSQRDIEFEATFRRYMDFKGREQKLARGTLDGLWN